MGNAVVKVDLQLDNLDGTVPNDLAPILYVAVTRVRRFEDLRVACIPEHVWKEIGNKSADTRRRKAEEMLVKAAREYAAKNDFAGEFEAELDYTPDYTGNEAEWEAIKATTVAPRRKKPELADVGDTSDVKMQFRREDQTVATYAMCTSPVRSERCVGIDQGRNNFAVTCVDRRVDENNVVKDVIVAARNYTNLNLDPRFDAQELMQSLTDNTDLLNWMQIDQHADMLLPAVERVITLVEYMDKRNRNSYRLISS